MPEPSDVDPTDPTALFVDLGSGEHVSVVPKPAREYQGMRAGVVTRSIAGGLDYAIVVVAVLATYATVGVLTLLSNTVAHNWPVWPFAWFLALGYVYLVLYLTVAWRITGRTYGDRIMGVRVVNFRGRRLRLAGALVRAAFCGVFPIGLFWCAVSASNRSVQDVVLRTSVIHDWQAHRQ